MSLYRLSDLQFAAPYLSAMDCILNDGKYAIYCSTELTSGLSVYKAMRQHGVHTLGELDKADNNAYPKIKEENKQAAKAFAFKVRREQADGVVVINPAPFETDWDQAKFYAFWDELLRTRVKKVRFNENWEFSNGCTYELAVALEENTPIFDSKGNSLEPKSAITAIDNALGSLHHQGFDEALNKLRKHRDLCKRIL